MKKHSLTADRKIVLNRELNKDEQIKFLALCIEYNVPIFRRTYNIKSDPEFKYYLWDGDSINRRLDRQGIESVSLSQFEDAIRGKTEQEYTITKSQLLELKNGYKTEKLREWFPEAFETVLKVGKWYKYNNCLLCFNGEKEGVLTAYGFYQDKEWRDFGNCGKKPKKWIEATESEVFEALKNEAVKRGFVKGAYFQDLHISRQSAIGLIGEIEYFTDSEDLRSNGFCIFSRGKWAEKIETISKSEAEKLLNKIII